MSSRQRFKAYSEDYLLKLRVSAKMALAGFKAYSEDYLLKSLVVFKMS